MSHDRTIDIGAIWLPGEIKSRTLAIDRAVQSLNAQIEASKEPRVDERFKQAWREFTSRWQISRDTILQSWQSRMFASKVVPILEDYSKAFQRWQSDFQRRIPGAAQAPPAKPEEEPGVLEEIKERLTPDKSFLFNLGPVLLGGLGALGIFWAMRKKT